MGIYSSEAIDPRLDDDPRWREHIACIQIKSPKQVVKLWGNVDQPDHILPRSIRGLWLPRHLALQLYRQADENSDLAS